MSRQNPELPWSELSTLASQIEDEEFLSPGDMCEGVREKVFADDIHCDEKYDRLIAERIAARLLR